MIPGLNIITWASLKCGRRLIKSPPSIYTLFRDQRLNFRKTEIWAVYDTDKDLIEIKPNVFARKSTNSCIRAFDRDVYVTCDWNNFTGVTHGESRKPLRHVRINCSDKADIKIGYL